MRQRSTPPRLLSAGLASFAMVVGLLAAPALAASASTSASHSASASTAESPAAATGFHRPASAPSPTGAAVSGSTVDAVQRNPLSKAQLPPTRPTAPQAKAAPKTAHAAPATSCTPADFSGRTGSALAAFVEASTTDCINTLFSVTGSDAHGVFQESQMVTIANAYKSLAANYTGDDTTGIWQVILYLRAGYYVQYNDATDVGNYDATLSTDVENALNVFFASPQISDVSSDNGDVLGDAVILTDSAMLQNDYLSVYKQILNAYNSSWDADYSMDAVVYDVYTPLWRGQYNPAFVTAVTADTSILTTLDSFALNHTSLLGGDNTFMDADAGSDLGEFVQFTALQATVRPLMLGLMNASAITGSTAALWVEVAESANTYDSADCSYYNVCNLIPELTAAALPSSHVCDSEITVLSQALSASDISAVCTSLEGEDPWFQNLVQDSGPVPNQYTANETMVVFASQLDYEIYGAAIYGVDTNNGGITLTGEPSQPGNQSYSLTYQWPTANGFIANIWNLNHEFTHYLDGRYDMLGDFTAEVTVPDVWWIEGVAEYTSYTYRGVIDTEAVTDAALHTYNLSTLFQNTYDNSDETRTYPWGYLAVRYMVTEHPSVVYAMLADFRTGNFTGGYAVYNSIGTSYDADFNTWLNTIAGSSTGTPTAAFSAAVSGLTATFTDQSTESGTGSITGWSWNFGDGATATTQNPSHTYAAAGTYTVSLTVTDSNGQTSSSSQSVAVSSSGGVGPCTDSNTQEMDQNCFRASQSAAAGGEDYLWIYLPAGTTKLKITTTAGTGTDYLYYDPTTWATTTNYTNKSTKASGAQSLSITNTTAGYRYITLYGHTAFSGVTVTTQY